VKKENPEEEIHEQIVERTLKKKDSKENSALTIRNQRGFRRGT
jgi:hypothetical protein